MFCFQCEQTAGCKACTGASGVCGKKSDTAEHQDKLTGALIGLARATESNEELVTEETDKLVIVIRWNKQTKKKKLTPTPTLAFMLKSI